MSPLRVGHERASLLIGDDPWPMGMLSLSSELEGGSGCIGPIKRRSGAAFALTIAALCSARALLILWTVCSSFRSVGALRAFTNDLVLISLSALRLCVCNRRSLSC